MILVTLGTQDKPFTRLLEEIEKEINKGNIKDKVIVQAGMTKFESKNMKIFDLIPMNEFNKMINECDLLITHGGVGCILTALKKGKIIIAAPRLEKYKEHDNDHQCQIIDSFDKDGYIIGSNVQDLEKCLKKAKTFKPKEYISNTNHMIELVTDYIDRN